MIQSEQEIKNRMRESQNDYIIRFRKSHPGNDWTDKEILITQYGEDLITMKYCYNVPKNTAKKILSELEDERT